MLKGHPTVKTWYLKNNISILDILMYIGIVLQNCDITDLQSHKLCRFYQSKTLFYRLFIKWRIALINSCHVCQCEHNLCNFWPILKWFYHSIDKFRDWDKFQLNCIVYHVVCTLSNSRFKILKCCFGIQLEQSTHIWASGCTVREHDLNTELCISGSMSWSWIQLKILCSVCPQVLT